MKVIGILAGGKAVWLNSILMAFLSFLRQTRSNISVGCIVCNGIESRCVRDYFERSNTLECLGCFAEALDYLFWSGVKWEKASYYKNQIDKDDKIIGLQDDPIINLFGELSSRYLIQFDYSTRLLQIVNGDSIFEVKYFLDNADLLPTDFRKWPRELIQELERLSQWMQV